MSAPGTLQLQYQSAKGQASHALPSHSEWSVRIGSAFTADVRLDDGDAEHCQLWCHEGKVFLEDLGSSDGTFVGDQRIDFPVRLQPGQGFRIGDVSFVLCEASDPERCSKDNKNLPKAPPEAVDQTVVFRTPQGPAVAQSQATGEGRSGRGRAKRVALTGDRLVLGRDVQGAGRIEHVAISRRHAQLIGGPDAWAVADLGSTNGTFVNGQRVTGTQRLEPGDVIALGPVLLQFTGRSLKPLDDDGVRVDVLGLTKTVRHRDTGQPLNLIDDVDMSIHSGEFVAMLGSSGCGKSTFMDAVNGRRRATHGRVLFNGRDLYEEFPSLKRRIGYVPQQVILHGQLSVEAALKHASRLRLPTDLTGAEIDRNIDKVLKSVGLSDRKKTTIASLSGGQQKRVAIAMELLSRPSVLFLDEVTSGLDMKTEKQMMTLFRSLADEGITILCITHYLDSLEYCHHVAYFFGGQLAFYGPPPAFQEHFGISTHSAIYQLEAEATPDDWAKRYDQSRTAQTFLHDRLHQAQLDPGSEHSAAAVSSEAGADRSRLSAERTGLQLATLTRRYVRLLLADRATLAVTLALAPVTAILIAFAASDWKTDGGFQALTVAFMAVVTAFFLGLFSSAREIVKELTIYLHERMVGLEIAPYLLSKIGPLALINTIQVGCLLLILRWTTAFKDVGQAWQAFVLLLVVALAGTLTGLMISSIVGRAEAAMSLMIFAIVPQLLFAGNFAELQGPQRFVAASAVTSYWAYHAMAELTPIVMPPKRHGGPKTITGGDGAWVIQVLVICSQCMMLTGAAGLLLLRKDGPGAIRRFFSGAGRIIQSQGDDRAPRVKAWFAGARAGIMRG